MDNFSKPSTKKHQPRPMQPRSDSLNQPGIISEPRDEEMRRHGSDSLGELIVAGCWDRTLVMQRDRRERSSWSYCTKHIRQPKRCCHEAYDGCERESSWQDQPSFSYSQHAVNRTNLPHLPCTRTPNHPALTKLGMPWKGNPRTTLHCAVSASLTLTLTLAIGLLDDSARAVRVSAGSH